MSLQKELYINAVQWINDNPGDKSIPKEIKKDLLQFDTLPLENKIQLQITLNALLKTTGLPKAIEKSLPWLTLQLDTLPDEMISEVGSHVKAEPHISSLVATSKKMYSLFQPKRFLNSFLQRVAYGEQDKAERLFKDIYKGDMEKIQNALCYKGKFTDYSGRTFDCTAYEYAYWAKDTHMCRMLESYMDAVTKAEMLKCCLAIEEEGLDYTQNGEKKNSAHFDFTTLKTALKTFTDQSEDSDLETLKSARADVINAQHDVPAHVAHEYCRSDRDFYHVSEFNEPSLPRVLNFYDNERREIKHWFPLDVGDDFAIQRGDRFMTALGNNFKKDFEQLHQFKMDLTAITRLDEVRTADLTQSRENLKQEVPVPGPGPS